MNTVLKCSFILYNKGNKYKKGNEWNMLNIGKKVLSIALVLALIAGMAACGGTAFTGNFTYNLDDFVTLGDYKGLEYKVTEKNVSEEEVQLEISNRLAAAKGTGQYSEVSETGKIENGDTANIDFEGKLDGVAFEGGTSKAFDLSIGSGQFIPGFEEGLIGVESGKTVDINVTFPEDYGSAELAGKPVVFTVKVNSISRPVTPEYNLDFVKANSKFTTIEEYEAGIKQELLKIKEDGALTEKQNTLWNQVMENATIKGYPDGEIEARITENKEYYTKYAEQSGMDLNQFVESYFGMAEADFQEYLEAYSENIVEQEMVMYAIAKAESISISDKEYKDLVLLSLKEQGFESEKAFKEEKGEDFETFAGKENLQKTFLLEKVIKFIVDESKETK